MTKQLNVIAALLLAAPIAFAAPPSPTAPGGPGKGGDVVKTVSGNACVREAQKNVDRYIVRMQEATKAAVKKIVAHRKAGNNERARREYNAGVAKIGTLLAEGRQVTIFAARKCLKKHTAMGMTKKQWYVTRDRILTQLARLTTQRNASLAELKKALKTKATPPKTDPPKTDPPKGDPSTDPDTGSGPGSYGTDEK